MRKPVIAQFLDKVWTNRILSSGAITSWKDGRADAVIGEAPIDLVGDDPKPMPARDGERLDDLLARCDEAGRVGGGVEKDEVGRWRHRLFDLGRIEAPAAAPVEPDGHGARSGNFQRADEIGPGWRRDQRLVASADDEPGRDLDRMHAADGDEEVLGREGAAAWGRAIDLRHVRRDRLAQLRDAVLPSIKRLAAVERGLRRLADERRGRQVALANPQGNKPLPAAAVIEDLDDAAGRDVAHGGADEIGPIGLRRGRSDVHLGLMDQRSGARKGRPWGLTR